MNPGKYLKSENGAVLVVSMLILVILTIIGVAATNTSVLELLISNSHKRKQAAFYASEAGLEHGKALLAEVLDERDNTFQNYNFLLDGSTKKPGTETNLNAATGTDFSGGVQFLETISFDNGKYDYTVRVWNHEDPTVDSDNMVLMRSVAEGTNGEYAAVEIMLGAGLIDGGSRITQEKTAVDGGGTGKNYNSIDANGVDTQADDGSTYSNHVVSG